MTGLTRDGLYLIEKGKVTRPVKNMRWNESPIVALNNIEAMTPPERVVSGEGVGRLGSRARLPRRAHPRVHVLELVGRGLAISYQLSAISYQLSASAAWRSQSYD